MKNLILLIFIADFEQIFIHWIFVILNTFNILILTVNFIWNTNLSDGNNLTKSHTCHRYKIQRTKLPYILKK